MEQGNEKEYGYEIGKDLFVNMTMNDIREEFGNSQTIIGMIARGEVDFKEAEEAVLNWRKRKGVRRI